MLNKFSNLFSDEETKDNIEILNYFHNGDFETPLHFVVYNGKYTS